MTLNQYTNQTVDKYLLNPRREAIKGYFKAAVKGIAFGVLGFFTMGIGTVIGLSTMAGVAAYTFGAGLTYIAPEVAMYKEIKKGYEQSNGGLEDTLTKQDSWLNNAGKMARLRAAHKHPHYHHH